MNISHSWVKIRLQTIIQLLMLTGSALQVLYYDTLYQTYRVTSRETPNYYPTLILKGILRFPNVFETDILTDSLTYLHALVIPRGAFTYKTKTFI